MFRAAKPLLLESVAFAVAKAALKLVGASVAPITRRSTRTVCSGAFASQILRPAANHSAGRPAPFCRLTWRYALQSETAP